MRSPSHSKSMGLVTKALQPAARARARSSGSWWAVTATMTVSLSSGLQVQVHQDDCGAHALGHLDGAGAVGGFEDVIPLVFEREPHGEARVLVVFDDEDGQVFGPPLRHCWMIP